jgi:GLPGLI family protein
MKILRVFSLSLIISFLGASSLKSQQMELFMRFEYEDNGNRTQPSAELRAFQNEEIFTLTTLMPMGVSIDNPIGEPKETKTYIYKNREQNKLISEEFALAICYIKDSLNLFNWEIKKERIEILGYTCTRAEASYRGRDYVAYFTLDLPFTAAPWKFHGLPGVILKANSKDSFLNMEASEIKIRKSEPIINPYRKEKLISWDEYEQIYRESIEKLIEIDKAETAKFGENNLPPMTAPPNIEIIMEENKMNADEFLKSQQKK